jgi:mono/diheme cytochrome c family protein
MNDRNADLLTIGTALAAVLVLSIQVFSHEEKVPKDVLTKKNPVASSDTVLSKAKGNYEENCLQCHGESGKGNGPMASMLKEKPADLTDAVNFSEMTDGEIYWIITKGRQPMPAFESKLTEEERWGLVNLMRDMSKTKPNTTARNH